MGATSAIDRGYKGTNREVVYRGTCTGCGRKAGLSFPLYDGKCPVCRRRVTEYYFIRHWASKKANERRIADLAAENPIRDDWDRATFVRVYERIAAFLDDVDPKFRTLAGPALVNVIACFAAWSARQDVPSDPLVIAEV